MSENYKNGGFTASDVSKAIESLLKIVALAIASAIMAVVSIIANTFSGA